MTATYDSVSFDVSGKDTDPTGLDFSGDGTLFYVSGNSTNTVYQFKITE